jgi:RNA polymerase sigma factor for flagellar operon FliA
MMRRPAHTGRAARPPERRVPSPRAASWHGPCFWLQPVRRTRAADAPDSQANESQGELGMETLLREAKEKHSEIPSNLKEQLVLEHTPLIRYIVNRIAVRLPSHIDLDDLHNTGVIGLMDAIEKYDPEKNCKFKTYAEFRIKGAILDQLRSLDWVPRSVRQKSRRLEKAYGEVEQRLGRSASEDEVADSLGLQIEKFHELLNQVRGISLVNLEEIRGTNADGDRTGTFADIVEDVHSENPFASFKLSETKTVIASTIATLPEKERLVVSLYYYEDLNMKEIGGILGITESRVCQIHTKAVLRLRAKLKALVDR